MTFNPQKILVINFGQIGDVILGLPALKAVREKFPAAHLTALIGKSGADIIEICGFADEKIVVDRVKLRDGNKLVSIKEILKLTREIRRCKFDFIIDLHSLYETNLLGFLSGAKHRLFAKRGNRSLDFLANFQPAPPALDRTKHLTDYYLDVLRPLEIENAERFAKISPRTADAAKIENLLRDVKAGKLVGMFPGAGNASRRWDLANFAALAALLAESKDWQIIVFLGPEETELRDEIEKSFPPLTLIIDQLSLLEFAAALAHLDVLIGNDTGAIHLAAIVGAAIVLVMDERAPQTYLPLTDKIRIVNTAPLDQIKVAEVFQATLKMLDGE